VLDHQAGVLDALALGQKIATEGKVPTPPRVILLTTRSARPHRTCLEASHVAAWLPRPATPSELLDSLASTWHNEPPRLAAVSLTEPSPWTLRPSSEAFEVLVVEDNEINRRVAVRHLEKLGCRVKTVVDGLEAVRSVEEGRFDLVFMDCQMPNMDGFEATGRIRALTSAASAVPIVALTAHAMAGDREKCLQAGMSDYLAKPLDAAELAAVVDRHRGSPGATHEDRDGCVDRTGLLESIDHDADFLAELLPLLRTETWSWLSTLGDALAAGLPSEVGNAAHALRGILLNARANHAAELARQLEGKGLAGEIQGCGSLLDDLRAGVERALREIERLLDSVRASASAERPLLAAVVER
jgi:CheY-like chemotaxis protein